MFLQNIFGLAVAGLAFWWFNSFAGIAIGLTAGLFAYWGFGNPQGDLLPRLFLGLIAIGPAIILRSFFGEIAAVAYIASCFLLFFIMIMIALRNLT